MAQVPDYRDGRDKPGHDQVWAATTFAPLTYPLLMTKPWQKFHGTKLAQSGTKFLAVRRGLFRSNSGKLIASNPLTSPRIHGVKPQWSRDPSPGTQHLSFEERSGDPR
jgi:hypothetical protein